jgi:hypothetical protein
MATVSECCRLNSSSSMMSTAAASQIQLYSVATPLLMVL